MIGRYRSLESEALWKIMQFHLMVVSFYLKTSGIINNYWTWLNSIVICQWLADHKSSARYFAIGKSNNCFIDHSVTEFVLHTTVIAKMLVAAKHIWTTTLRKSRPLFVGSYLQTTWWALNQ